VNLARFGSGRLRLSVTLRYKQLWNVLLTIRRRHPHEVWRMGNVDEPIFGPDDRTEEQDQGAALSQMIGQLVAGEPFAVLCTQGEGQPYGSVIAFAASDDLGQMAFCTSRATRKYRLLRRCQHVSLVIDDRSKHGDDTRKVSAVTVTGRATEIASSPIRELWHGRLVARHPYLEEFLTSPTCSLFLVDVVRYLHVVRFQEVSQWVPRAKS
jgi:hypothetical protein